MLRLLPSLSGVTLLLTFCALNVKSVTVNREDGIVKRSQTPSSGNQIAPYESMLPGLEATSGQLVYNDGHKGQENNVPEYLTRHPSLQSMPVKEYERLLQDSQKYEQEIQAGLDLSSKSKSRSKAARQRARRMQSEESSESTESVEHAAVRQSGSDAKISATSTSFSSNDNGNLSKGDIASFYGLLGSSFVASAIGGNKLTKYVMGWNEDEEAPQERQGEVAMQEVQHPNRHDDGGADQHALHKRGHYTDEGEYVSDHDYEQSGVRMPAVYGQHSYPHIPLSALRNPVGFVDHYAPIESHQEEGIEQQPSSSRRRKGKKGSRALLDDTAYYPPPSSNALGVNTPSAYLPPAGYIDGAHASGQPYYTGPPGDVHMETLHKDSHGSTAVMGGVLGVAGAGLVGAGIYYGTKGIRERRRAEKEAAAAAAAAGRGQASTVPPVPRQSMPSQGPPPAQRQQMPASTQRQQQQGPSTQAQRPAPPMRAPVQGGHHLDVEDYSDPDDKSIYSDEIEETDPYPLHRQGRPEGQRGMGGGQHGGYYRKRSLQSQVGSEGISSALDGHRSPSGRKDLFGEI